MPSKWVVVFDTVTIVQSLISKTGPAVRCLELFEQGRISLAVSIETLSELREVLGRSSLRTRYSLLTDGRVDDLIEVMLRSGEFLHRVGRHFEYPRDPDDEPFLNLAIEAKADFLVTRDKDLLDLMRMETAEGREFQRRFPFIRIMDPAGFLRVYDLATL